MKQTLFFAATLLLAASTMLTLTACGDDDPVENVTPANEIPGLPDSGEEEEETPVPDEGELIHEFAGWLNVSCRYFSDSYYGEGAVVRVYRKEDGTFTCQFHDKTWGDGRFDITTERGQISGTGTLEMPGQHGREAQSYEATMSGPMTKITISVPSVMGGTNITWNYGTRVGGTFTGTNNVNVGDTYDYSAENVAQTVTVNADGSVNLTVSQYQLSGTVMGDLTLGQYTISNIPFNQQKNGYYKEYADGNLKVHFKAVKDGTTTYDSDFLFNNQDGAPTSIFIKPSETGITVENKFWLGRMPFLITAVMNGTK